MGRNQKLTGKELPFSKLDSDAVAALDGLYLIDANTRVLQSGGSIIPSPGSPPPGGPNVTTTISDGVGARVNAAGSYLYSTTLNTLLNMGSRLENYGVMWAARGTNEMGVNAVVARGGMTEIVNQGLIVAYSQAGSVPNGGGATAIYLYVSSYTQSPTLLNTGQIYAISETGSATGIAVNNENWQITNRGLIAASASPNWTATGVTLFPGVYGSGSFLNDTGGRILAEGGIAIGVRVDGFGTLTNAGEIRAASTNVNGYSVGVLFKPAYSGSPSSLLVNSGIIAGDFSVLAILSSGSPIFYSNEVIQNETSGQLIGILATSEGQDTVRNAGLISGIVQMGSGNDLFDTSLGSVSGIVDMGWDNDHYIGSNGDDDVAGGRNADLLEGRGGNDLILGEQGNDVVIGGAGNDGLYGGSGDDQITTQAGDYVRGGDGNDLITATDLTFELISGDNGYDTLVLANSGGLLDLVSGFNAGRIAQIEQVNIAANQQILIRSDQGFAGLSSELVIAGNATNSAILAGSFVEGSNVIRGGQTYRAFTSGSTSFLVDADIQLTLQASVTNPGSGLPSIAGGELAPIAAPSSDYFLFSGEWIVNQRYTLHELQTVIDADETIIYPTGDIFFSDAFSGTSSFTNYGTLISGSASASVARIAYFNIMDTVTNYGTIISQANTTSGASGTILQVQGHDFFNYGTVEARGGATSTGYSAGGFVNVTNFGRIAITGGGTGTALQMSTGRLNNSGTISASGSGYVTAVQGTGVTNSGLIEATDTSTTYRSVGIWGDPSYGAGTITNSGDIRAEVAIFATTASINNTTVNNSGRIFGDILLGSVTDIVRNSNQITGAVRLGGGTDTYDGTGGTLNGIVYGEDGNDSLTGGSNADWLEGGTGDDSINGAGGLDRALYTEATSAVTVDLRITTAQNTIGAGVDTLTNIEGLIGSAFGDTLIGNSAANYIEGAAGNDIMTGYGGNDTIDGGTGSGDEARYAGNQSDYLVEEFTQSGQKYFRVTGLGAFAGDGVDILTNVEFLQFANARIAIGNSAPRIGPTPIPDITAGDSVVFTYQIPAGAFFDPDAGDVLRYRATSGGGYPLPGWISFDPVTRTFTGTPPDWAIGLPFTFRVYASDQDGTDPDHEVYDEFTLTVTMSPGADVVGTSGNDSLYGTFRVENMYGLDGNDTLFGSSRSDRIDGGAGTDIVDYSMSYAAVNINLATGAVSGGDADGDVLISIEGIVGSALNDNITGSANADLLWGGNGNDSIFGGSGDDQIFGGNDNDSLFGNAGNDIIDGGVGVNDLHGSGGNDRLIVGAGADGTIVEGGADTDTLVVAGSGSLGGLQSIEAIEFQGGATLNVTGALASSGFAANSTLSGTGSLVINMGSTSGTLNLQQFVTSAGANVGVTINGSTGDDTLYGVIGSVNTLNGGNGADTMVGGNRDDIFTGGAGNDNINGGAGSNDEARYAGNRADYLIENITINGAPAVRVTGQGARAGDGVDTLQNVEYLQFADMRISMGVNPNNRPVLGQPAMVDQTTDDSRFYSYQIPATSFIDIDQDDVLSFRATLSNGAALPAWLAFNSVTRTFSGTPPIEAIGSVLSIRVYATDNDPGDPGFEISDDFVLTITQAPGADVLGTSGNDILSGTFRNETMIGLEGDDVLNGSAGADRLDGGAGNDIANYAASSSAVTINLATGAASGGDAQGDFLISMEGVIGSAYADNITGTMGWDFLWGGNGSDTLHASGGDDRVFGEAANDFIYGEDGNDWLSGGSGSDYIEGGIGADILFGDADSPAFINVTTAYTRASLVLDTGTVADQLLGGDGDDVLFVGFNDSADGGANGTFGDTLYVSLLGATSGVTVDFRQATVTLGTGTVTGFEHVNFVEGSNFDDTITMRSISETYVWSAVHGMAGNDHLIAGSSTIEMYGDEGDDVLDTRAAQLVPISAYGGIGNDTFLIDGNTGVRVDGGAGYDILVVNGSNFYATPVGIEEIQFAGSGSMLALNSLQAWAGVGSNIVLSGTGSLVINIGASAGTNELYLQSLVTAGGSNVTVTVNGSSGGDVVKGVTGSVNILNGGDGSDTLRGGQRADILNGGDGNDKIEGGQGADILTGGAGADVFRYQAAAASGIGAAADRITDFVVGTDRVGFGLFDPDPVTPGDQSFTFIGTGAFHATGVAEIRYADSGSDIIVQADVNGDGVVDMEIILQGIAGQPLSGTDFVL